MSRFIIVAFMIDIEFCSAPALELCSQCGFFELCSASGLEPSEKKLTSSHGTSTFSRAFYNYSNYFRLFFK